MIASFFDVQGHRGARGLLPENTIPAFEKALELGVTTLEMDVVVSKDGKVVVSHEPWFSALICSDPAGNPIPEDTQHEYRIYELTYEEITQYDCGQRGNTRFPHQKAMPAIKPLLSEVIAFAEAYTTEHNLPTVQYNIETKSQAFTDNIMHPEPGMFTHRLVEVIQGAGISDRAIIQSFDLRTLQVAREIAPDIRLALLVGESGNQDRSMTSFLEPLGFTPAIFSPHYRLVTPALLKEAHTMQVEVIPWTINTLEEMQALKDMGVDGVITDYPDLGVQLLP